MIPSNDGPNAFVKCLLPENRCDGKAECDNCFDESYCPHSTKFFCEDGHGCVDFKLNQMGINHENISQFCDGIEDCDDGSDDKSIGFGFKCVSESNSNDCIVPQEYLERYLNNIKVKLCHNNANQCFRIENGIKIFDPCKCWTCLEETNIYEQQVCNGIFDCPDLFDKCVCKRDGTENICKGILGNTNCSMNEVSCPEDGRCSNALQICDGTVHCSDGFDEKHCIRKRAEASDGSRGKDFQKLLLHQLALLLILIALILKHYSLLLGRIFLLKQLLNCLNNKYLFLLLIIGLPDSWLKF